MNHKCDYCDRGIEPCAKPCPDKNKEDHVCCTCNLKTNSSENCELPVRIVCDNSLCNLKYQIDWYKIKFEDAQGEITKMKALLNQFRLANIGTQAAQKLIDKGELDISGIKLFTSKQRTTWDQIPVETGYILMTLHEEFAKQWGSFLNEKAVKIHLKKELIENTEKKLKKAQLTREGIANNDGSRKSDKQIRASLNPFEKIVFHNMKSMGLKQPEAEKFARSMGATGESRDLERLGII